MPFATQPILNRAFTFRNRNVNAAGLSCGAGTREGLPHMDNSHHSRGCRMESVARFFREEDGQDVVEYGLLIATIAIVVLIGVGIFGSQINTWFENLAGRITTTGTK
jgi:pilus assembly protein Flp/PilA